MIFVDALVKGECGKAFEKLKQLFLNKKCRIKPLAEITINLFSTNVPFYTLWKHQKTSGFLMFSVGIEVEHWLKIG